MSVHDRGTKKWTSLMLPEHIEMLKEWERAQEKVEKPILAEEALLEMNQVFIQSLENEEEIMIRQWQKGFIKQVGPVIVTKIAPHDQKVYGLVEGREQSFSFHQIVGAEFIK